MAITLGTQKTRTVICERIGNSIAPSDVKAIITQPSNISAPDSSTISLRVVVVGYASIQWYRNSTLIPSATTFTYTTSALDSDAYYAILTDANSSTTTTSTATVSGSGAVPSVITHPASLNVIDGQAATISLIGSGYSGIQWYRNNTLLTGAIGRTLAVVADIANDQDGYFARLSNSNGTTDTNTSIIDVWGVDEYPVITTQESSQAVTDGGSVTFTTDATGYNGVQWYKDGASIAGAISPVYTFTSALADNGATYYARYTNFIGYTDSATATLTVVSSTAPPLILTQPQHQYAVDAIEFTQSVISPNATSYQWYLDGVAVSGATSSEWLYTPALAEDLDEFYVSLTNANGTTVSEVKTLTVSQSFVFQTWDQAALEQLFLTDITTTTWPGAGTYGIGIGTSYTDALSGRTVTQVADNYLNGTQRFERNDYSRRNPENADGTYFFTYYDNSAADNPSNPYVNTQRWLIRTVASPHSVVDVAPVANSGQPQWHPTDANKIRYVAAPYGGSLGKLQLFEYDITTSTSSVIADFTAAIQAIWPTAHHITDGSEGSPSWDGRYYSWMVRNTAESKVGLVFCDIQTATVIGSIDIVEVEGDYGEVDHSSATPSGDYQVVSTPTAVLQYDQQFNLIRILADRGEHSTVGQLENGSDFYTHVQFKSSPTDGEIFTIDLSTGTRYVHFDIYSTNSNVSVHFSGICRDKPGYFVVSTYNDKTASEAWASNKVFIVHVLSNTLTPVCRTRTVGPSSYWAEVHGACNKDLTRIYYNSEGKDAYYDVADNTDRALCYMVDVSGMSLINYVGTTDVTAPSGTISIATDTLTVSITDAEDPALNYTLIVDDVDRLTFTSGTYDLSTLGLSDATYTIKVRAVNDAGLTFTSAGSSYVVSGIAAPTGDITRGAIFGNSMTKTGTDAGVIVHLNGMFAEESDPEWSATDNYIAGGATWATHLSNTVGSFQTAQQYDVTMLMGLYSDGTYAGFMADGSQLINIIKSAGSVPVLVEAWVREDQQVQYTSCHANYVNLAAQEGVQLIPVGTAVKAVIDAGLTTTYSSVTSDNVHPNTVLVYIYTACLYRFFTGADVSTISDLYTFPTIGTAMSGAYRDAVETHVNAAVNEFWAGLPAAAAASISITAPSSGDQFNDANNIAFAATVTDTGTPGITTWFSSIDGQLGTGDSINTTLSTGNHTITASVSGSDSVIVNDVVGLTIVSQQQGAPTITSIPALDMVNEATWQQAAVSATDPNLDIDWTSLEVSEDVGITWNSIHGATDAVWTSINGLEYIHAIQNSSSPAPTPGTIDVQAAGSGYAGVESVGVRVSDLLGNESNAGTLSVTVEEPVAAQKIWIDYYVHGSDASPSSETVNSYHMQSITTATDNLLDIDNVDSGMDISHDSTIKFSAGTASGWDAVNNGDSADSVTYSGETIPDRMLGNCGYSGATSQTFQVVIDKGTGASTTLRFLIVGCVDANGATNRKADISIVGASTITGSYECADYRTTGVFDSDAIYDGSIGWDGSDQITITVSGGDTGTKFAYIGGIIIIPQ